MNEKELILNELRGFVDSSLKRMNSLLNEETTKLYWGIGKFISDESKMKVFGDSYIGIIAEDLQNRYPQIKGFSRSSVYRMKLFYETYKDDEFALSYLLKISWSKHTRILDKTKSIEERHFYLKLCAEENYSYRQLVRQIDSGYYERHMTANNKDDVLKTDEGESIILDPVLLENLNLPEEYKEVDIKKAIISNMKDFILEVGDCFTYIGEESQVEVGGQIYRIDLLFYHRALHCLVAFEIKLGEFKPEYISKMDFYLEALDRQKRKADENPSVGIILCASQNEEVVEYAMSRTMSPMMVKDYLTELPDKEVLKNRLEKVVKTSKRITN